MKELTLCVVRIYLLEYRDFLLVLSAVKQNLRGSQSDRVGFELIYTLFSRIASLDIGTEK